MTRNQRKKVAAAAILFGGAALSQAANSWAATLPAFPGAEGFGANATGGRGGDVYHVTTLVDDPNHLTPGSLFYGLYEKNVPATGRTIVFDVGGTIHLGSSTLDIKNINHVTIAGQTAPSPITIIGNTVQVTSSGGKETGNIILQDIAIRKGLENSGDALTIHGAGNTHDIIADHISGSWSEDEVISTAGATNHSENVTVQYSTMSEALTSGHQYGALIRNNQSEHVSYDHNYFSDNDSRNPRPGTYLGTQLDFEFQNNVIYNWSDRAGYTGGASETDVENVNMNYVGNYVIAGPSTVGGPTSPAASPIIGARRNTAFTKDDSQQFQTTPKDPLNLHVYQSGNKVDWGSSVADPSRHGQDIGWTAFAYSNGTTLSAFHAADENALPFAYPAAATADTADDAYAKVVASAGAFAWARTATDVRLFNEVQTYTGTSPQSSPNATEYNAIVNQPMTSRPAGWDTDQDGMPDSWETLRGFNPNAADNNIVMSDGYTRLEHYLQYLTAQAVWNPDSSGNWSDYLSWRGMRPSVMDSTANFTNPLSAPRTINLDMPVTVGQMNFDSAQSYTLAGANGITFDVISGSATMTVNSGSHAIFAPLTLADDTILTTAASSGVTLSNLQPSAVTLTKAGAGGVAVNNLRLTGLNITGGTVLVMPDGTAAGVSRITTLAAAGGTLDITNNHLVTATSAGSYNGSAYTGVSGMVQSGRNGGTWNGSAGIVTSQSDATTSSRTSIGVARASDVGISATAVWAGQTVSSSDTLVMYTYGGDANLDGKLNIDDYTRIDTGIAAHLTGWSNGDFNYDGKINIDDYTIIDSNIGTQGAPFITASGFSDVAAIPEPSTIPALFLLSAGIAYRQRRHRPAIV